MSDFPSIASVKSELRIGSEWTVGKGASFESACPVNNQAVWAGNEADTAQVNDAFAAARTAFGPWWDQPVERRIEVVEKFAELVKANADELAEVIAVETGKVLWETKTEVGAVAGKVAVSIDAFRTRRDTTSFELNGMQAVTRYKPHGVVAVLGPFNFPAHLPNGHIVPALIAGNTIVFKPSEQTPAVGAWMVQKWQEAGLPDGVLNLVQGGREVGQAISANEQLDGLFFTGSSRAGQALNESLASQPNKILALEMGGNNPLIVHRANNHEAAAYQTVLSAYITSGQRCTCARRLILVEDETTPPFLDALEKMIARTTFGFFNDDPQPFMGTVISQAMGQHIVESQDKLIARGGKSIVTMKTQRDCSALVSPGLIDVTEVADRVDEELFGPMLSVIRVADFDAAIAEANRTKYGLSAGLLSDDEACYKKFIHEIRAGVVNWNRQTTGASGKLPFGGCGLSGNNRPAAYFAADYCSFPVASLESKTLELPEKLLTGIN